MEFVVTQQVSEENSRVGKPFGVVGIHYEDESLGVRIVMSNQGTHVMIVPCIPHGELDLAILDLLDIEANSRYRIEIFGQLWAEGEGIKDSSLASCVQPGKEYPGLLDPFGSVSTPFMQGYPFL